MRSLLLGILLIFSSAMHATTDAQVIKWTTKTLINTFSVDYNYSREVAEAHSKNYTLFAWEGLRNFLGQYVQVIRDKKLTIHPVFLIEPRIVDSGVVSGINYWRVNEEIQFPELNIKVAFSVVVIATNPPGINSYIIQSLDMVKQESP